MADLIKIFYDLGEVYANQRLKDLNQIYTKNIKKILFIDLKDYSFDLTDPGRVKERLFLRVTSSNGGNLYPVFYAKKSMNKPILQSLKNMKTNMSDEECKRLDEMSKSIESARIDAIVRSSWQKDLYVAFTYEGRTFYEIFPDIATRYIEQVCSEDAIEYSGECFVSGDVKIGSDSGLNFCSTNEMPDRLTKSTKWRLLPLSAAAAGNVMQGFEKVFETRFFKFRLFGLDYIALPSILYNKDRREIYDLFGGAANRDKDGIVERAILEQDLEFLVEELHGRQLSNSVLLTFVHYQKNNNEIALFQTIDDVAPSRISRARKLIADHNIDVSRYSKYAKADEADRLIYLYDYLNDGSKNSCLNIANIIFGKKQTISSKEIYHFIYQRIFYGDVQQFEFSNQDKLRRKKIPLSSILGQYRGTIKKLDGAYVDCKNSTDFAKHQRLIDFLEAIVALSFPKINIGGHMDFVSLEAMLKHRFGKVDLLQNSRARELYVLGAFARLVMDWQSEKGSKTVERYLDTLGSINSSNADRVFRKAYDGARKYGMNGPDYDYLLQAYTDIKAQIKQMDRVSADAANIAFVMGSIDYKNFKSNKTEGEN